MPKPQTLSKQLRAAVEASGFSRYRIAKELGVNESTLSRFMAGGGLDFGNLDALGTLLGLGIVQDRPPRIAAKHQRPGGAKARR